MSYKYQELMKSSGITIDHPGLDPAYVSKVNTFEEKVGKNELTDQEITAADDELVELFKAHEIIDEDSDEVKELKLKETIAEAKAAILESEDVKELTNMKGQYKDFPEILALLDKRIAKIGKDAEAAASTEKAREAALAADKHKKAIETGTKEINMAKYEELQAMGEKYKDYPELVKIINERHEKEKPQKLDEELKKKILSKSEWSYSELRAIGIAPTGNDMAVAGVKLEKEYLLEIYAVRK
jgi:hypothetical protein